MPENCLLLERDTFLSALSVLSDDFVQPQPRVSHPGPALALGASQALTLLVVAQWRRFATTRDFNRYAQPELRSGFPTWPDRSQFVRQAARCYPVLGTYLTQVAAYKPTWSRTWTKMKRAIFKAKPAAVTA